MQVNPFAGNGQPQDDPADTYTQPKTFTWDITTHELQALFSAAQYQGFKSQSFRVGSFIFHGQIYPNGTRNQVANQCTDSFDVSLFMEVMPSNVSYIWTRYNIYCPQTDTEWKSIALLHKTQNRAKWRSNIMYLDDAKKHVNLTLICTIDLLSIIYMKNSVALRYIGTNIYNKCVQMDSESSYTWHVEDALVVDEFLTYRVSKYLFSEDFGSTRNWCLICAPNGETKEGNLRLALQLLMLPCGISKLRAKFTLKCNFGDVSRSFRRDFSYHQNIYGWDDGVIMTKLLWNEIKTTNQSLELSVHVSIVDVFNSNGHEIPSRSWSKYGIVNRRAKEDSRSRDKELQSLITEGFKPRYEAVEMVQIDDSKCGNDNEKYCALHPRSCEAFKLLQKIRQNKKYSHWNIEGDPQFGEYFDAIIDYLNLNGEYNPNPMVILGKKSGKERQQSGRKRKRNEAKKALRDVFDIGAQNAVIEECNIKIHSRITALNGQKGLRAKLDIASKRVIGQYLGVEYLETEYEDIYHATFEGSEHEIYSFAEKLETWTGCKDNDFDNVTLKKKKKRKLSNGMAATEELEHHVNTIVIDGLGLKRVTNECKLIYMNDCRKSIHCKQPNDDDDSYWNVEFVSVYVNGWPQVFAITRRNITKNEELAVYYGHEYEKILNNRKRWVDRKKQNQKRLAKLLHDST